NFIDKKFKAVRQPPVKIPSSPLLRNIKRFFIPRPVIIKKRCISCGRCVEACPLKPKAIEKKKKFPVYYYQRCIRCYCCQEVCPAKAIEIRNTVLGHLLPVVPYISLLIAGLKTKIILPKKKEN
ncbi:MAG: 4Fe-4S binding protein, partial [Chitinispirillaceae bacterium]|nr:4Fe-4S binding protein [Chitinispirillaceae bacterium]